MPKYVCDKCGKQYSANFCPNCGDKRTKQDKEQMTDTEIIIDMIEDAEETITKKIKLINKTVIVGLILLVVSALLFFLGMYYKNAYYNNKNTTLNVYVKDDSSNYIINSNYFSGYMSLSGSFLISGVLVLLSNKKKRN
jgi:predicted histidine transporter YuiF (NhaC family)